MRRRSKWERIGTLALFAGVSALAVPRVLRAVGRFLVVDDPLEESDVIVVMSGEIPFRQFEAARLFHRGLAPRILLTRAREPARREKLRELGLGPPDRHELARRVLERLNVPPEAIGVVTDPAHNTAEELTALRRYALTQGLHRLIIISSPDHMRRIQCIWRRGVGVQVEARLHPAPEEDGFDPERWWASMRGAKHLGHEYLGMLRFLLGSPPRGS